MASDAFFFLGTMAWLVALLAPPVLALWFRQVFAKRHGKLGASLLFGPSAIVLEWASVWIIGFAAHDNGEGPPGIGLLLILPLAAFVLSLVGYYCAALFDGGRSLWRHFYGS